MNDDLIDIEHVEAIIGKMKSEFTSYDFIKKYMMLYENEYIALLNSCEADHKFQTVHSAIGRFLSDNRLRLEITTDEKTRSENIFGNPTQVQCWKRVI